LPPDDRVRIEDMVWAGDIAGKFMSGRKRNDLDDDLMLLFAVVRAIEIVGEAASKVGRSTRAAAPDIPWPRIVSMRNRLIHGYSGIDSEIVWKTTTDELPRLLPKLRQLLVMG